MVGLDHNLALEGRRPLSLSEAAQHVGFTPKVFKRWLKYHLLPTADPNTRYWYGEQLRTALNHLQCEGHQPTLAAYKKHQHLTLPNVHPPRRSVNHGGYNGYQRYYYFRPTGERLQGLPGEPRFMQGLIRATREWCKQKTDMPDQQAKQKTSNQEAQTDSRATAEQQQNPPGICTDALLQMGGAVPSDHPLPLYPSEFEIGQAVLGPHRAHEWPALAAHLPALPPVDPIMGGRFRPLLEAYFAARHGLDGGPATKKRPPSPEQQTRIAVSNPRLAKQGDTSNESILLTPEELCTRWRDRVTTETLANWRIAENALGPAFIKIGRATLYPIDEVRAFEQRQLIPKCKS